MNGSCASGTAVYFYVICRECGTFILPVHSPEPEISPSLCDWESIHESIQRCSQSGGIFPCLMPLQIDDYVKLKRSFLFLMNSEKADRKLIFLLFFNFCLLT